MSQNQSVIIIPYNLRIIFALFLVIIYLSNDAYLTALPQITREYLTTQSLAQFTITVWFIGAASLQLFLGPLSEWSGRRPILLTAGVFS